MPLLCNIRHITLDGDPQLPDQVQRALREDHRGISRVQTAASAAPRERARRSARRCNRKRHFETSVPTLLEGRCSSQRCSQRGLLGTSSCFSCLITPSFRTFPVTLSSGFSLGKGGAPPGRDLSCGSPEVPCCSISPLEISLIHSKSSVT